MSKQHAHVANMAMHINMVGPSPINPALCLATILTSKLITEIMLNYSEFYVGAK